MGWISAGVWGVGITAYFVVTIVYLPDWLLNRSFIRTASSTLADLIVVTVWAVALGALLIGLHLAQRRGWI